jgi:glycosyltransferase involved in cell wall biosynthesis
VPYRDRANFERGITNKPVEYLAYSLPIITSLQRGPLVEMLLESGAGRTYRNTEPATLAAVILESLSDSGQLKAMRSNARELFERTFHPDKVFGDWIEIIEAVAAK